MAKKASLFGIEKGWIKFRPEKMTREQMDIEGRQLKALHFGMIQKEVAENDEIFVVFYDIQGSITEALVVVSQADLLEIEAMLRTKRNWRMYYYAIPIAKMPEGLRRRLL